MPLALENSWYILRVRSGSEDKIASILLSDVRYRDFVSDVYVTTAKSNSTEADVSVKKKLGANKNPMSGYMFVKLYVLPEMCKGVLSIPGIYNFMVHAEDMPCLVSDDDVVKMRTSTEAHVALSSSAVGAKFVEGDKVCITSGAFEGFSGLIVTVGTDYVTVSVFVFGQAVNVDLSMDSIKMAED